MKLHKVFKAYTRHVHFGGHTWRCELQMVLVWCCCFAAVRAFLLENLYKELQRQSLVVMCEYLATTQLCAMQMH